MEVIITAFFCIITICQTFVGFDPNVRVDDDPGGWSQVFPSLGISSDGDTLYCVFRDFRYGFHDFPGLTLAKSSDCGTTWVNQLIYYGEIDVETSPRIVVDSQGWLHVVFGFISPGGVWYTRSTDNGINWTFPVMISDTMSFIYSGSVSFIIDGSDNLYVMWHYYYEGVSDGYDIFFTKSMDHGATWLRPNVIVNDTVSCHNQYPTFCFNGHDTIFVVWKDNRLSQGSHIFFSRSINAGIEWLDTNIKVNADTNLFNFYPQISSSNNVLYCVWAECPGWTGHLKCSKSTDDGNSWTEPVIISEPFVQEKGSLRLDVDSLGNLYVVWPDSRQDTSDIFFSYSSDSGNTWHSPNIRVNDDTTQRPQTYADLLVKGSDDIYVVWTDSREDTVPGYGHGPDIYFARGSIISSIEEKQSCALTKINLQTSPNPFNKKITVRYTIHDAGPPRFAEQGRGCRIADYRLQIKIYDISGHLVRSFNHLTSLPFSQIIWDGTDKAGFRVPTGVYFIILKSLNYSTTKKVVFVK